jgi:transcriptional regulator with XRE-family HTH domain
MRVMQDALPVNTHLSDKSGYPRVTGIEGRTETVGDRIRERQRAVRVDNEELAAAAGVHKKTVSQWRHNHQEPTDDNLMAIVPILQTTFMYLKNGIRSVVDVGKDDVSMSRPFTVREGFSVYSQPPAKRLPPRAYELVYGYTKKLEDAGLSPPRKSKKRSASWSTALTTRSTRASPARKAKTISSSTSKAAWQFVREVVNRSGKKL